MGDRYGTKSEKFDINGDLGQAQEIRSVWTSWCSCYSPGLAVNGDQVCGISGLCYRTVYENQHAETLAPFKKGQNVLSALGSVKNAHGMEINFPGVMVLIRY